MLDDMYRTCKYCRNNINGRCVKSSEVFDFSSGSEAIYEAAESGKLSEAIREGIKLPQMSKLEKLLAWYAISQKRQKAIIQAVREELTEFIPAMVECIDSSVSSLIINLGGTAEGLELKDPDSFCCKYFE